MKFFIAIFVAASYAYDIATYGRICSCSSINYQPDCSLNPKCQWRNGACVSFNCSSITTQSGCFYAYTCAWVNNTCGAFTKCSDYSQNANISCSEYGSGCDQSSIGTKCQDITITQPCTSLSSSPSRCNAYSWRGVCKYSGSICRNVLCSDYTESNSYYCRWSFSSDFNTLKVCSWSGTACAESTSLSHLNATTCYSGTVQTYTWNPSANACVKCSSTQSPTSSECPQCSSNAYMLIIGLLIVDFF